MPNYNKKDKIESSILSVLNQDYRDWELIIIDNYSDDGSEFIIKKYLNDDRIKFIKFANGGSIAASRNIGIKNSTGDYIAFLDSDDMWFSNKLSKSINVISEGYDFVHHRMTNDFGSRNLYKKLIKKSINIDNYNAEMLLKFGNPFITSSVVIRKYLLIKKSLLFNESKDLCTFEDFELWYRLLNSNFRIKYVDLELGCRTIDSRNTTTALRNLIAIEKFMVLYNFSIKNVYNFQFNYLFYHLIRSMYLTNDKKFSKYAKFYFSNYKSFKLKLIYMYVIHNLFKKNA